MITPNRCDERNKSFQKPLGFNEIRQDRENSAVQLRKKKRIQHITKKRANFQADKLISENMIFPPNLLEIKLLNFYRELFEESTSPATRLEQLAYIIKACKIPEIMVYVLGSLKNVISRNKKFPFSLVCDDEVVTVFMQVLISKNTELITEALWCLINIFADAPESVLEKFLAQNILPSLCELLRTHPSQDVVENCIWALGNFIGERGKYRIYSEDLFLWRDFLSLAVSNNLAIRKVSAWALTNYIKSKPILSEAISTEILAILPSGLFSENHEILRETCWICYYITQNHSQLIKYLFAYDYVPRLEELLQHHSVEIQYPVAKIYGNIFYYNNEHCEDILQKGLLQKLGPLLTHPNNQMKSEVLFIFSNILAGSKDMKLMVLNHPCNRALFEYLNSEELTVKKEAFWVLSNAALYGCIEVLLKLQELKLFPKLLQGLFHIDVDLLMNVLEGLLKIFKVFHNYYEWGAWVSFLEDFSNYDGFNKIESLLSHPNHDVVNKAEEIMKYREARYGDIEYS